jgi:hypothetical protein
LRVLKCFRRFDTVINHFPASDAHVREQIFGGFARKARLGESLAGLLMKIPGIERLGRTYLSRSDTHPGRLYSFLCERPS